MLTFFQILISYSLLATFPVPEQSCCQGAPICVFATARSSEQKPRPSDHGRRISAFGMHLQEKYFFNLSRWVGVPRRQRRKHSGRDVEVQGGMLDIKEGSGGLGQCFSSNTVCVFPAEEPSFPLSSLPFTFVLSHQKTFVMLIELKAQPRMQPSACAPMRPWARAPEFEQSPQTCLSGLSVQFTERARRQSSPYSFKSAQTPPPGSQVTPRRLSVASPVCLSCHPFHHPVILLSICLHSSAVIGPKKKRRGVSLQIIRPQEGNTKLCRSLLLGPNPPLFPPSFCFLFFFVLSNAKRQIIIVQSANLLCARNLTAPSILAIAFPFSGHD